MLHAGLWPVHPLADPSLIRFGEWLPREWRARKRLHSDRLHRLGCATDLVKPPLAENFAPVMEQALHQYGLDYLRRMLADGATLIEQGYVDPDGLVTTIDRLTDGAFARRDTEIYAVIAVEAALRAFADSPAAVPAGRPSAV